MAPAPLDLEHILTLSDEACAEALEGMSGAIDKYAQLVVAQGAALKPGQELVLSCPVEAADFARRVVRAAYAAGAGHVTVIWADDECSRMEYESVDIAYFTKTPSWKVEQLNSLAEQGASFVFLEGSNPDALAGIDPAKPAAARKARNSDCDVWRKSMDFGKNVWSIAGVPVASWACKVFAGATRAQAMLALWQAILLVARVDDDPASSWDAHDASFQRNLDKLNSLQFDALRYTSSNGTNLTLGLTHGHVWEGGSARTVDGTRFFPNIPTEEVFTSPDRMRADGVVYATMPLVHSGSVVRDFWLRFEGGEVVEFDAAQGKEVLAQILATDDGARRLGECALIDRDTPIRRTGLLFYSTLYDENASCHLALGTGFPECLDHGLDMDVEGLLEHGVNHSLTHVDFMIGADDLSIVGVGADGKETPVFVDGRWAW